MTARLNSRGQPRQRWPATPSRVGEHRRDKVAFKLSPELYARIKACADRAQLSVSSWLEQVVREEVERRAV